MKEMTENEVSIKQKIRKIIDFKHNILFERENKVNKNTKQKKKLFFL